LLLTLIYLSGKHPEPDLLLFLLTWEKEGTEKFCLDLVAHRRVCCWFPASISIMATAISRIGFGRKNLPECVAQLEHYMSENPSTVNSLFNIVHLGYLF
jgi:hypothetical protein